MNGCHKVPIIFTGSSLSLLEENLLSCISWPKVDIVEYLLLLDVILEEALNEHIASGTLSDIIGHVGQVAELALVAHVVVVDRRELKSKVVDQFCVSVSTC